MFLRLAATRFGRSLGPTPHQNNSTDHHSNDDDNDHDNDDSGHGCETYTALTPTLVDATPPAD